MGLLDQIMNGVTSLGVNANAGNGQAAPNARDSNAGMGGLGGLGDVAGAMLGGSGGKGQLLRVLLGMLASGKFGGLDGLLNKFNNNGMQNQLASWVSTRENEPVSPVQVEQALGADTVKEIAQQAGMDQTEAAQGLSEIIPQLVDKVTPTGVMPQQDIVSDAISKLSQRF
jgi:uncharacterized protein YidB (DUF937 family)